MKKLKAGDKAPEFELESNQGRHNLTDYAGKWLVIYFYPKDNTPGCTTEACDFRDALKDLNISVLGISPDSLKSHKNFSEKYELPFPLLSDPEKKVAAKYAAYGEKKNYGKTYMGIIRSTFIINPEGKIAAAMYNVRAKGHVERLRKKLAELRG